MEFPYSGYEQIAAFAVPDVKLSGFYAPRVMGEIDKDGVLERGFAESLGAPRLCASRAVARALAALCRICRRRVNGGSPVISEMESSEEEEFYEKRKTSKRP
jgi:hypothetical protein